MTTKHGPYLSQAFFCERVLHEQDGVLSFIRIFDTLNLSVHKESPPPIAATSEKSNQIIRPNVQAINLVIGLRSGDFVGKGTIGVEGITPSGKPVVPQLRNEVTLGGDQQGVNLILVMGIRFQENGVYWFDIYFEDRWLTRTPLLVSVSATQTDAKPAPKRGQRAQSQ